MFVVFLKVVVKVCLSAPSLQPSVLLVPFYGQLDALFQLVARMESQLIDSRLDVASPVALFQNVVFVVVQSRHLASHPSYVFAKEGYQAEHPYRRFDAQEPCVAQLVVKQVAECFRLIYFSVAEEVFASVLTMVEGKEYSLHHILNVYESDVLTLEAYREIDVLLDAFAIRK